MAHGRFADDFGFRNFTATRLQAWYRKEKTRWTYTLERFPVYHIAALQIQYAWKAHCQHKLFQKNNSHDGVATASRSPRLRAALALQSVWKRYTNRRIYRYYRDLITFQNTGDPARMLRTINPSEAGLLDAAMGAHVRFRLGGMAFPPTIYYKIFTRKAVCDVNAFSPKDYTLARQTMPHPHSKSKKHTCFIRVGNAYYRAKQAEQDTRFWYRRIENNGWRPVTAKVVADATNDPVAQATNRKSSVSTFHYSSLVRKQDAEKQRRLKKRMWMHKLYTQGLLKETTTRVPSSSRGKDPEEDDDVNNNNCVKVADVLDVNFEHAHWEEDADAMFEWASALDYDAYVDEWQRLGKTASTDDDRGY
uniref:Uncharacterized protein n=1 Tax=Globisporangium ultimum (strain ATCC 200006 / CBS 805.95 / DAOM BR144) TaxID=431595 RepID=K3WFF6_GLOUD